MSNSPPKASLFHSEVFSYCAEKYKNAAIRVIFLTSPHFFVLIAPHCRTSKERWEVRVAACYQVFGSKRAHTQTHPLFSLLLPCNHLVVIKTCQGEPLEPLFNFNTLSEISRLIFIGIICVMHGPYPRYVCHAPACLCLSRWLDVLRHSLSVSDGSIGGGAESAGAGQDPTLVYHEAAERLPRAPQQACRHMLLLLGGSYVRGTDWCNRHRHILICTPGWGA